MHLLRRQAQTTHLIADCNPFTYCSGQLSWDCSSSKDISSCCVVIDLSYSDYPGFSWFLISESLNSNHNYIASYLAKEQKNRKTFSIPLQFPCLSLRSFSSRNMLSIQKPPRQAWLVMSLGRPGTNGTDSLNPHTANGIHLFGVLAKLFPNVPSKFEPQKDLWHLDFQCFCKLGLKPVFRVLFC